MTINPAQRAKLLEGLHPGRVHQLPGRGGKSFSHLQGWDVRATLIRIFGFGGFSAEVFECIPGQHGVIVGLRLTVFGIGPDGEDAVYSEYGAGAVSSGMDLDDAVKTAATNALKRAATNLGDQFGLSLYDNGRTSPVVQRTLDQPQPSKEEKVEELRQRITDLSNPTAETEVTS